jgi:bifunctional oligoribonuclease and PAP phosphatase NrnA
VKPATPERAAFHEFVSRHRRLLLTTHLNPDGDGIGSEIAMALWLRTRGNEVQVLNDSMLPRAFVFLADHQPIESWDPELAERRFSSCDALIVLDTSNRQRIGRLSDVLDRHIMPIAVVDHHVTHAKGFGQVNVIEPDASATGELVYDLIREAGDPITPAMADALYVALMTDTGSFRYSNTDSHAHRMAAELLTLGADPQRLHAAVHSHATAGRLRFFGEVLVGLEIRDQGRVAALEAGPEVFARHGVAGSDTEGLVDLPRTIAGVDVVVLFSEAEAGRIKVSMRSTGRVTVDRLAASMGGGGHPHAAGAMVSGTRADVRARVLDELSRLVSEPAVTSPAPAR